MPGYQEEDEDPFIGSENPDYLLSMVHVLNIMEVNLNGTKLLDLSKLVSLDLSYNLLNDIPTQLSICSSLQSLNISHNNLTSIESNNFFFCGTVTMLDLSYNNLSCLPSSLAKLPMLSHLSVSHNKLCFLPDDMESSSTIVELLVDNNKLTNLPNWMSCMIRCSTLSLAHNPLGDLLDLQPAIGQKCRRLKYLDLSNISMHNMQSSLCRLLDLRHLTISNVKDKNTSLNMPCLNSLSTLPTELYLLRGLVKLIAVGVKLEELPDSFHHLRNLKILDVSKNNIRWLPSSFHLLPKLRFLNISNNNISMLPLDFEKLPCLNHLLASNNQISELPEKLGLNNKLVTLDMYNNKLYQVQDMLFKTGIVRCDFALNYLRIESLQEEIALIYLNMEKMLRSWVEDLGEGYQIRIEHRDESHNQSGFFAVPAVPAGRDRRQEEFDIDAVVTTNTTTELQFDLIYSSSEDSDPSGDETEESSTEDINKELNDTKEIQSDDFDDLDFNGNSFDLPSKFQFWHNLERMDLEQYWGRDQFCPADQHCTRINEIILHAGKVTNRTRQEKVGRYAVHRADHVEFDNLVPPQDQFEDADAEDVSEDRMLRQ